MLHDLSFRSFQYSDTEACLELFEQNCPDYFAENEREEFVAYLNHQNKSQEYWLCEQKSSTLGAFGLHLDEYRHVARINWIIVSKYHHKAGIGKIMMREVISRTRSYPKVQIIHISASQHSAPFFAHFGAVEKSFHENGWGPAMHRIEMEMLP